MLSIPIFQNSTVHLIFLLGGDKVIFYGTPFSLHHSVALQLDKEDPEQN